MKLAPLLAPALAAGGCLEPTPDFVDPRSALLLEWRFGDDANVRDTTAHGYDLELEGAIGSPGLTRFDGLAALGRGPDLQDVWPGLDALTLEARVRITDTSDDFDTRAIVYVPQSSDEGYYGTGLVVNTAAKRLRFEAIVAGHHAYSERDQLYADEWITVHGVFDGATMQLFVDGEAPGDPIPAAGTLDGSTLQFGEQRVFVAGRANGDERLGCELAAIRIFTRALVPDEIAQRHEQLAGD
ncbi:MAG: LamG domain-containing protein [Nannocystaceae bacterium]|nr:LamG domain-containing protein [Nannocystaceae bacterium]